jgi:1-acyl-sn-glycerol-3-phosphate acyltransferase
LTAIETARFAARASATLGATAGYLGRFEAAALGADRTEMLAAWVPRWARALLQIYRVELSTAGPIIGRGDVYPGRADSGVGRVFVSNHRSAMDILITFAFADARLVSRADLAKWPLVGGGARRIGTLFVDRASMRSGATVLKEMVRALGSGVGIAIYPEGTAFSGDEVRRFKPGAFKAAQTTGAEVIPLGIAYDDPSAYFGDESFLDHARRVAGLPRLRCALVAGDPILVGDRTVAEASADCRERVQDLVGAARRLLEEERS